MTSPSRADAWSLLAEWTSGENLRKHALAVETSMRGYARHFGQDDEAWGIVGLLHDLRNGAGELGLPLADLISYVIRFMRERAGALGLAR